MIAQNLSLSRLWLLLRCDFLAAKVMLTYIPACFALTIFVISLHQYYFYPEVVDQEMYKSLYVHGIFIWGLIATFRAFRPINKRVRKEAYLLLPASSLEKLLSRLLAVTVGLGIALAAMLVVLSILIELFNWAIFGSRRPIFDPFDPDVLRSFGYYCLVQSPVFLCAAWFRKHVFLKTVLSLLIVKIGFIALALITVHFAVSSLQQELSELFHDMGVGEYDYYYLLLDMILDNIHSRSSVEWHFQLAVIRAVLILLPPVLWWIAFLRFREVQANDGI